MTSAIFNFVLSHWEDILITLGGGFIIGLIFLILGINPVSGFGNASGLDILLFLFLVAINTTSIYSIHIANKSTGDALKTIAFVAVIATLVIDGLVMNALVEQRATNIQLAQNLLP